MTPEYTEGFIQKCAELNIDPEALVKSGARGDQLMKFLAKNPTMKTPLDLLGDRKFHRWGPAVGFGEMPYGIDKVPATADDIMKALTPRSGLTEAYTRGLPGPLSAYGKNPARPESNKDIVTALAEALRDLRRTQGASG